MQEAFQGLEPEALWRYFDLVTSIPRCSGKEEKIREAVKKIGREKGLEVREDKVGNVVLAVPASPGKESSPTVVLQGHLDMVCEKNRDVDHDFETQGIRVVRDGDWITAEGTTLGADNGVAIAAALALLDDPPSRHGPLELLFTVDEERGLTGAGGIEPHMLKGRILLNLDSEEEGYVTVGCAGGGDTLVEIQGKRREAPKGWEAVQVRVFGLTGGHSGIDILENRANSLKCLARVLDRAGREAGGFLLHSLEGGSKRNAIPREALALVSFPPGGTAKAEKAARAVEEELKGEFGATDPGLKVEIRPAAGEAPMPFAEETGKAVVGLILGIHSGVYAMDRNIPGLVETSNNLGVAETKGDTVSLVNCTRSSVNSALEAARAGLRALGETAGGKVTLEPAYPGWKPNLDSRLLQLFKKVHKEVTGKEPEVMAIHAGLECGILGEHFPGMDMISIGPDMKAVHSPDEKLSIPSTQRFYKLLKTLLEALA